MNDLNLITDPWITCRRRSGATETIAPWQITEGPDDPFVDIVAPRPDFRSALYQFMIGLLQTCCAPANLSAWGDTWGEPLGPDQLRELLIPFCATFQVGGPGPRFLQDAGIADSPEKECTPIGAMLIDEPGVQTVKRNGDLFIKRGRTTGLSLRQTVNALITLQCMAPAGGAGNRTSLRGGGPLTTLLLPGEDEPDSLFHRLWLNVLDVETFTTRHGPFGEVRPDDLRIFPWMGPCLVSDKKGVDSTIENCHPLQALWGMPRRIWLDLDTLEEADCVLGDEGPTVIRYRSRPYGANYTGAWRHPYSPYYDTKEHPLPQHPQPGGFGYRHWYEWTQGNENKGRHCASVVAAMHERVQRFDIATRLWSSGFDMDNMKARCFYEAEWPLLHLPEDDAEDIAEIIEDLTSLASDAASTTRSQIKAAWLRRPGDHSDGTNNQSAAIHATFFQTTEAAFFEHLAGLHVLFTQGRAPTMPLGTGWMQVLVGAAYELFDRFVPVESIAEANADRIARARNDLGKYLHTKSIKETVKRIDELCADHLPQGAAP